MANRRRSPPAASDAETAQFIWDESFELRHLLEGGLHLYGSAADDAWLQQETAERNQLLRDAGVPVPWDPATALEVRCVQSAQAV